MRLQPTGGRRRCPYSLGSRGFTLVEALVALAILGVVLVGALETTGRILRSQAAAEHHLEAVALADQKLNELVLLPDDSLNWYSTPRTGEMVLAPKRYRWSAVVRRDDNARNLWQAAVTIRWPGGRFDLETVFYRRERLAPLRRAR